MSTENHNDFRKELRHYIIYMQSKQIKSFTVYVDNRFDNS